MGGKNKNKKGNRNLPRRNSLLGAQRRLAENLRIQNGSKRSLAGMLAALNSPKQCRDQAARERLEQKIRRKAAVVERYERATKKLTALVEKKAKREPWTQASDQWQKKIDERSNHWRSEAGLRALSLDRLRESKQQHKWQTGASTSASASAGSGMAAAATVKQEPVPPDQTITIVKQEPSTQPGRSAGRRGDECSSGDSVELHALPAQGIVKKEPAADLAGVEEPQCGFDFFASVETNSVKQEQSQSACVWD